jgi:hypothetical protein
VLCANVLFDDAGGDDDCAFVDIGVITTFERQQAQRDMQSLEQASMPERQ